MDLHYAITINLTTQKFSLGHTGLISKDNTFYIHLYPP